MFSNMRSARHLIQQGPQVSLLIQIFNVHRSAVVHEHGVGLVLVPEVGGCIPNTVIFHKQSGLDDLKVLPGFTFLNEVTERLDQHCSVWKVRTPIALMGHACALWQANQSLLQGVVRAQC